MQRTANLCEAFHDDAAMTPQVGDGDGRNQDGMKMPKSDDGVVIIKSYLDERFRRDRIENANQDREVTIAAGMRRVRPCSMTTATTLLALIPN